VPVSRRCACFFFAPAEPFYLEGHGFEVLLDVPAAAGAGAAAGSTLRVGHFGRVHPLVLEAYKIPLPVSAMELNLEALL
jgi:phenylalanyl-tRNA synthetase beta subunit